MALKPLGLAGTLLAFVGLTTYLIHPTHSSEEVLRQARQIAELNQTISNLQTHNQQLERKLQLALAQQTEQQTIDTPVADPTSERQSSPPASDNPANITQANAFALLQEERLRHKNEEYDLWIKNALQNGAHPTELMRARFEQEAVDDQWAPKQEQKILELFSSSDDLRGTAVKSTKCRTTQCEISLATNSQEQSFQQFEKANKAFQNRSPGNFVTFVTNMETNTTTLYISTESTR
jgi:hypothetical protein